MLPLQERYHTMPRPQDTAQRLLASRGYACRYCSATASWASALRFTPTTPSPLTPYTRSIPQLRHYAQAATAPTPDPTIDEPPTPRRRHNPDGAQYPFPSKKNPSPYEVMHLSTTADPKDIKQRCTLYILSFPRENARSDHTPHLGPPDYRLALLYHPDSTHPSSSPHAFALLNRAYKLLSSPHARATYHRTGHGWGTAHDVAAGRTGAGTGAGGFNRASDEELRRQARARAYSYAYSSPGGAAYAGAGGRGGQAYDHARWGGRDGAEGPNPNGNYTTNTRFIGSLLIVVSGLFSNVKSKGKCELLMTMQSVLFSMIQYNRALNASLWTQELLDAKHMGYVSASDTIPTHHLTNPHLGARQRLPGARRGKTRSRVVRP